MSYLKSSLSNLSEWKISCRKEEVLNFGKKRPCFSIFEREIVKDFFHIWNSTLNLVKLRKKQQSHKMSPKLGYLGIFEIEFFYKKCQIWNYQPQSSLIRKFWAKKFLNLAPKMSYMGTFKSELLKTIVIFEISNLEFV